MYTMHVRAPCPVCPHGIKDGRVVGQGGGSVVTQSQLGPGVPLCVWMPVVGAGEPLVTGHVSVSLGWACGPAPRGIDIDKRKRGLWWNTAGTRTPSSWWLRELSGCWGVGLEKASQREPDPMKGGVSEEDVEESSRAEAPVQQL